MKTIVHFMTGPYLPLTETWIYEQIKNVMGYRQIIYTFYTENLDIFRWENIRSLNITGEGKSLVARITRKSLFYSKTFKNLLIDKPDIVFAHFGNAGYNFLRFKSLLKIPLITRFYGYDISMSPRVNPSCKKRYKILFKKGDLFIVEGNFMKKSLIELGCQEEKIIVHHLGVDTEKIVYKPRMIGKGGIIKILISASFREKKGIPYAVEAFGRIYQHHKNLRLTIIGGSGGAPREEKEKEKILNAIDKYRIKEAVKLMGYQPYSIFLEELYKNHIFLSPSVTASNGDTEGGAPVSIIEASASGMPVLSTYHCDIPEVVLNGKSGFLVPERNTDLLSEKLEHLIADNKIWIKMGKAARKHIDKNYNVIKQAKELEEIYKKIL